MTFKANGLNLILIDEPDYIQVLTPHIDHVEYVSTVENYLLVYLPVWSGYAMVSIAPAIEFTKQFDGLFHLGMYLTEGDNTLLPQFYPYGLPASVWMFYTHGTMIDYHTGQFDKPYLSKKVEKLFMR